MGDSFSNFISGTLITSLWGFLSFVSWGLLTTFYSIALMKAMKSLPKDKQSMAPGLAFLGFVPGLGVIWHAVFGILVAAKLRKQVQTLGQKPNSALAFSIAHPSLALITSIVSLALFFNLIMNMVMGFFGFNHFIEGDFSGLFKGITDLYLFITFIDLGLHLIQLPLFLVHWITVGRATSMISKETATPPKETTPEMVE